MEVVVDSKDERARIVEFFQVHPINIAEKDASVNILVFIYVIASGPDTVKIGYSANPQRRLGELQVGHEKPLQIVYKEQVPEEKAPVLEKIIHKANRHKCIHGEWFSLTHEQATREVQFALIRYLED